MESLRKGKPIKSVSYFYPSITLFLILSFSHLPVWTVGYNLKNLGMAYEAQLLITIGHGGVWSVGSLKHKLRRVIKGMECPFVWATPFHLGKKYYYMIVKKKGGITPPWRPWVTQAKSARAGVL